MSVRTTELAFTVVDGTGTAVPNQTVTFTLTPPEFGVPLKDTAGELITTTVLKATSDSGGAVSKNVIPNGDITPAGSTWTVAFLDTTLINSFVYSGSPIDPTDWAPAGQTLGLLRMTLTEILGDTGPVVGRSFKIALNSPANWTGGIGAGQLISNLGSFTVTTASDGSFGRMLVRQSELNPSDGYYILTEQGGAGAVINFTVPTLYTNDAGAWAVGTTYALNDVVRDPATDIPYISLVGSNVGHALTDATKWAPYAGEKITDPDNMTAPGLPSSPRLSPSGLLYNRVTLTADTTLTALNDVVRIDATAGNVDVTLPDAATWPGKVLWVRRTDSSGHTATLTAAGTDTILGSSTSTIAGGDPALRLMTEGTDWQKY